MSWLDRLFISNRVQYVGNASNLGQRMGGKSYARFIFSCCFEAFRQGLMEQGEGVMIWEQFSMYFEGHLGNRASRDYKPWL